MITLLRTSMVMVIRVPINVQWNKKVTSDSWSKQPRPIQLISTIMPYPIVTVTAYLYGQCASEISKRQCLVTSSRTRMNVVFVEIV